MSPSLLLAKNRGIVSLLTLGRMTTYFSLIGATQTARDGSRNGAQEDRFVHEHALRRCTSAAARSRPLRGSGCDGERSDSRRLPPGSHPRAVSGGRPHPL